MTYRAAVDIPGLPRHPEPRIYCDGCPASVPVARPTGQPYAWFLAGKPPKGWRSPPRGAFRWHWCPTCRSWADKLLAAGLVRKPDGWQWPDRLVRELVCCSPGLWTVCVRDEYRVYPTEAEAARAWLGEVPRG